MRGVMLKKLFHRGHTQFDAKKALHIYQGVWAWIGDCVLHFDGPFYQT